MIKANEWYFVPAKHEDIVGQLDKIIKVHDNPNYVDVESWWVTEDRKFVRKGIIEQMDSVIFTKFGKKVTAPPKMFEVLYSESVEQNDTDVNIVDNDNEYSEE